MPWWLGHPALPDPHAAPSPTRGQHSISDPKPLLEPLLHGFYPFYSIISAMHTTPSWDWGFPRSLEFPLSEHHPSPISVWNSLSQSTAPSQPGIPSQGIISAQSQSGIPSPRASPQPISVWISLSGLRLRTHTDFSRLCCSFPGSSSWNNTEPPGCVN